MRYFRLLVGIVVVVVALWIIVGEQISGSSADAVVNARVATLRAPVAGTIDLVPRALGARIDAGETLASVTDPLVDNIRLNDLRMEQDLAASEVQRLQALIEDTQAIVDELQARGEAYHEARVAEIENRLEHARNRLAIIEAEGTPTDEALRVVDAVDENQPRLPAEPILTDLALEHARERVETLEIALQAAENGVYLGDGYNDAPNSQQRVAELKSELASQSAALADAERRATAYGARLDRETLRVNALTGGDLASPFSGQLWEILADDGEAVQRGDPILRLLDCGSVMVTLSVTEMVYNDLTVGQAARYRDSGTGQVFAATVTRLAGSGAATVYRNLAVAPSERHLERFDVALAVPALAANPQIGCAVGRTGRAFFDRRPLDWLRR